MVGTDGAVVDNLAIIARRRRSRGEADLATGVMIEDSAGGEIIYPTFMEVRAEKAERSGLAKGGGERRDGLICIVGDTVGASFVVVDDADRAIVGGADSVLADVKVEGEMDLAHEQPSTIGALRLRGQVRRTGNSDSDSKCFPIRGWTAHVGTQFNLPKLHGWSSREQIATTKGIMQVYCIIRIDVRNK